MQISNGDTPCDAPVMSDAPPSILSTKCGGAHEISGIKASIFLCGLVEGGGMGGGGVGWGGVVGWVGGGGSGVGVGRGRVVGWVMVGWGWVGVCVVGWVVVGWVWVGW